MQYLESKRCAGVGVGCTLPVTVWSGRANKVNGGYIKWKGRNREDSRNPGKRLQGMSEAARIVNADLTFHSAWLLIVTAGRRFAAHLKAWHSEAAPLPATVFSGKLKSN